MNYPLDHNEYLHNVDYNWVEDYLGIPIYEDRLECYCTIQGDLVFGGLECVKNAIARHKAEYYLETLNNIRHYFNIPDKVEEPDDIICAIENFIL